MIKIGIIVCFALMICSSAKAQKIGEIQNPNWQEVTNTGLPNSPDFEDNVYVDINGIIKNEDNLIFDLIDSDVSYWRIALNCSTNSWNVLRSGFFISESQVEYQEFSDLEENNSVSLNQHQEKIFTFVCNVANKKESP